VLLRSGLVLRPGGTLHLATDIDDYAEQMLAVCQSEPLLEATRLDSRPPWRPVTRFESRGEAAGRRSSDILAVRRDVSGNRSWITSASESVSLTVRVGGNPAE